jgi:undecaprenyl diphosphate synthase
MINTIDKIILLIYLKQRVYNMYEIPNHIAIIMDGNRRWAERNKVSKYTGHKRGASKLKNIISECVKLNITELSVFAFSTENWNREITEVNSLLKLIEIYIKSEIAEMKANNIRFKPIGDKTRFNQTLYNLLESAEKLTSSNKGLKLNICLNYGGIGDIIYATKSIAEQVLTGQISIQDIDTYLLKNNLISSEVSDIDLLIRTSGEKRLSNFLPIQLSYSEMYFTECLWPDFDQKSLYNAFDQYSKRERRFGSTPKKSNESI